MKAALLTNWETLEMRDIEIPVPGEDEILVKISFAGICGSDVTIYSGRHPTATTPVVMGHEFVGTVEQINTKKNTEIQLGDRIVPQPLISCGNCEACREGNLHVCRSLKLLGIHVNGGFEQYACVPIKKAVKISDNISDKVAALTEPFAVGFHVHSRANTQPGDRVLIIGAGPIGIITGLTAKYLGVSQIVFSEINPKRTELAKSFGFENFINPQTQNAEASVADFTKGEGFEKVFEVSGTQAGISFCTKACKIRGTIIPVGFPKKLPEFDVMAVIFKELSLMGSRVYTMDDFIKTTVMLEALSSQYNLEELISDVFPLEKFEEALKLMISGQNLGKILIETK